MYFDSNRVGFNHLFQMSQSKLQIFVRDAVIGARYFYGGIHGQCYNQSLYIGKPLGILLVKMIECDSRQPGGREPTYMLEFTEWKGMFEWDEHLGIMDPVKCWS